MSVTKKEKKSSWVGGIGWFRQEDFMEEIGSNQSLERRVGFSCKEQAEENIPGWNEEHEAKVS